MRFIPGNTPQGTFAIVVAILLLLSLKLGLAINNPGAYFSQNLLPEITGMLVELVLMLFLVEQWKKSTKQEQLIMKEKRLRELLIFFMRYSFKSFPLEYRIGSFYGTAHTENINSINSLITYIQSNSLSSESIDAIKSQCIKDLATYGNLLPVVSELTEDHFKAWIRIQYFMNRIINDGQDTEEYTISILVNIRRFENASFENGIYFGSKNLRE